MIILGIESATMQVGAALGGQEGVFGSFHAAHGMRHAETLTPAIQFVSQHTQIAIDEVSVIAVDLGPGLFTGLRVGIATAKAMAMALHKPMIGISSLDLLAYPVRNTNRLIVPVIDGRRGEVFWSTYRHVQGGVQRMSDYVVGKPDDLAAELEATKDEVLLLGDGALRYADAFAANDRICAMGVGNAYPSATALVELAQPKALREEFVQPHELEPLYLRKSDAEVNWDLREAQIEDKWSGQNA